MTAISKNDATKVVVEEVVAPILSEDQIRSEVAAAYEERLALLEAKLSQAATAPVTTVISNPHPANNYQFGVNPFQEVVAVGDTLVHFVGDGFTIGSRVYYRGQEAFLPEAQAMMSRREQIKAYGDLYFALGPWDGEDYDLEDPNLTPAERAKLAAVVAARPVRPAR